MLHDFDAFSVLTDALPPLVRKQRKLEALVVPLAQLSEEEKQVRKEIDALLVKAGIEKGDGVTCLGYDVLHLERKGAERLNQDLLVERLILAGLEPARVRLILAACTEVGEPSAWATVKPSKGAKVKAPMAKADLKSRRA